MPTSMSIRVITLAGCAALALYLSVFTAGMLLDSKPYRQYLATPGATQTATAAERAAIVPAVAVEEPPVSAAPPLTMSPIKAFAASMLLYTPTNVAVLTILAGFIGGCASLMTFGRSEQGRAEGEPAKGDARAI